MYGRRVVFYMTRSLCSPLLHFQKTVSKHAWNDLNSSMHGLKYGSHRLGFLRKQNILDMVVECWEQKNAAQTFVVNGRSFRKEEKGEKRTLFLTCSVSSTFSLFQTPVVLFRREKENVVGRITSGEEGRIEGCIYPKRRVD
jgi:hypothetical protein